MILLTFWGVRGSIPTPGWNTRRYGGNTSCYELRFGDTLFILDAGTGLRELGVDLIKRGDTEIKGHLFFSHPHWDHIQGFPFFTPAYQPTNTFWIYGADPSGTRYFELLSGQMKSDYFPVQFSDLNANILPGSLDKGGTDIDGVRVTWLDQHHPGTSFAYKFEKDGFSVVFATDNELDKSLINAAEVEANPDAERLVSPDYIRFINNVDLLIGDGQYTDSDYVQKVGWGHPRAFTLVDAAVQANVKRLAITHHDPMRTDQHVDELIRLCRARAETQESDLVIFGAREGVTVRVDAGGALTESRA
jgi:phosphoribosyl 1,2-cyclic phosphodiesterase